MKKPEDAKVHIENAIARKKKQLESQGRLAAVV